MSKHGLLMPFNDQSQSFRDGFECGILFEKVRRGEELKQYLIQNVNRDQAEKIFIRSFYEYTFYPVNEDWIEINAKQTKDKLN